MNSWKAFGLGAVSLKNVPFCVRRTDAPSIKISVPLAYRQNHTVYLGTESVQMSVLQERVRQKMESAPQKDVFLRGDRGVNLGEVMEVVDLLKAAGVRNVGLVTKMPDER